MSFNGVAMKKYVSIPDAELYAFDVSASWQVSDTLTLFSGISLVIGRNRDSATNGSPPSRRPTVKSASAGMITMRAAVCGGSTWWFDINSDLYAEQNHPAAGEEATPPATAS